MSMPCGYTREDPEGCGAPATTHFLFAPRTPWGHRTAALACPAHLEPARSEAVDEHPVGPDCPSPTGRWIDRHPRGTSFCMDPDAEIALHESLHQPEPANA